MIYDFKLELAFKAGVNGWGRQMNTETQARQGTLAFDACRNPRGFWQTHIFFCPRKNQFPRFKVI